MSSNTRVQKNATQLLPELIIFDLDACLWDQEMFEMTEMPSTTLTGDLNGRGQGVIGVMSGNNKISLHKGSLVAFQDHIDGMHNNNTKFALASSANTPFAEQIGRTALKLLEIIPGITVWDVLLDDWDGKDVNQIGRQPPLLSPDKSRSHFPRLRRLTGVRYDRMLYFDDCNWDDHCGRVASVCREERSGLGPAFLRTPNGLGVEEWRRGLRVYEERLLSLGGEK